MTELQTIVSDPEWLPAGFDPAGETVHFAKINREGLVREAFLDQRMMGSVTARASAPIAALTEALNGTPRRVPSFIFHTAFCCSTLLARALDAPGQALALKEPNILLDLANAARVVPAYREDPSRFSAACQTIFLLLARPHKDDERVLIKPTNTASTLAPVALAMGAPSLFLYGGLDEFLVSILKKGEEGRSFVRTQYNIYALDGAGLAHIPARQAMALTDLQVSAAVWRHQIEQFASWLAGSSSGGAHSLDFKVLLDRPGDTLAAIARRLKLPLDEAHCKNVAAGPIFARDSKFESKSYSAEQRHSEEQSFRDRWRPELELIAQWAARLNLGTDVRLPLPKPVI